MEALENRAVASELGSVAGAVETFPQLYLIEWSLRETVRKLKKFCMHQWL